MVSDGWICEATHSGSGSPLHPSTSSSRNRDPPMADAAGARSSPEPARLWKNSNLSFLADCSSSLTSSIAANKKFQMKKFYELNQFSEQFHFQSNVKFSWTTIAFPD